MANTEVFIVCGQHIGEGRDGFLCLNDLHRLSNESGSKAPSKWRSLPTTKELTAALEQNSRFSAIIAKTATRTASYSKRGKGGGTYAHPIRAPAYAEWAKRPKTSR